jgi:hypothetical protein
MIDPSQDPYNRPPDYLRLVIPFLPPSANKLYITDWKRKTRFVSREASAFKQRFNTEVIPKYLPWISQLISAEKDNSVVYNIFADIYFDKWEILNKGFFGEKRTAKTRYKKMDTGNRFKFLFDCVASAIDIDDSHYFGVGGRKLVAQTYNLEPQVHIFLTRENPSSFGC